MDSMAWTSEKNSECKDMNPPHYYIIHTFPVFYLCWQLHALSCCMKAVCTADAAQAVETCRLSCGGHGYMTCSSMPSIYGLVTAASTYEGENTVMLLQTARYLMKAWQQAVGGMAMPPTVAYLKDAVSGRSGPQHWENSTACIIRAFQQVAAGYSSCIVSCVFGCLVFTVHTCLSS